MAFDSVSSFLSGPESGCLAFEVDRRMGASFCSRPESVGALGEDRKVGGSLRMQTTS
jgi:hypothetical protein